MAPYRHFTGKEDLLEAVAARGFEDLAGALKAADASAEGVQALAAQGAAYIAFAGRRPALFRLMFMSPGRKPAGSEAYRILARRAAGLAGPAMPAEDLTLAAWSLVHGLAALILDRRVPLEGEAAAAAARRITLSFARLTTGG